MSNILDPTLAMRELANSYPDVDETTACTQISFKTGKKSFFFVGEQGGRYKAMFKLKSSKEDAAALAQQEPENYQVGSNIWVTARFSAENPMPPKLWKAWMDESYGLTAKPKK